MDVKFVISSVGVAGLFVLANALTLKSLEPGMAWLMLVVSVTSVGGYFAFRFMCAASGLAIAAGIVDSVIIFLTLGIAVFIFDEQLTIRQYVGLVVLLVGLYLVRE
jgi:drug/metabolite transporter (DMT)-like permease